MVEQRIRRALISVYNKAGIEQFAQGLQALGFIVVSSGGTHKYLTEHGVNGVLDVRSITGMPPILGHRVVTLHPKIHGGILALDTAEHNAEREQYGIPRFDLVCVDVYPVWEAIADPAANMDKVVELTDIGGPAMLRAAAKNHQNVIVICDPAGRTLVLTALQKQGEVSGGMRRRLAQKVFSLTAKYDAAIRKFYAAQNGEKVEAIFMDSAISLAYAENRCQNPADLFSIATNDPLAMSRFYQMSGDPSYITIADASQITNILRFLAEAFRRWKGRVPFIVIAGKHGNPCGAGIDWNDSLVALNKALYGDSVAIMGGEVVTNFPITDALGQALMSPAGQDIGRKNWGLDVILASEFCPSAIELLGKREKRRLLANPALADPPLPPDEWVWRQVAGGFLRQRTPSFVLTPDTIKEWVGLSLTDDDFASLLVAWACCWFASSNTVALAKDGQLIGLGCGQQDRIACVRLCLDHAARAYHDTKLSVFASDAFFPYATSGTTDTADLVENLNDTILAVKVMKNPADILIFLNEMRKQITVADRREGPELLRDAGCIGGVVPADGKELPNVQEFFRQAGMSVAFLALENRGFAKH